MKYQAYLLILTIIFITSCTSTKNKIYWVSGLKTECTNGVGKMLCLNVHKGENFENPSWELFYDDIEGFTFEKGHFKKIEVTIEEVVNPPADASSLKYSFAKELERKVDNRVEVDGNWRLTKIHNNPINRSIKLPELKINLNKMRISGSGGCNNYTGVINEVLTNTIEFSSMVSTKKACLTRHIEQEYFEALNTIQAYKVVGETLNFYNNEQKEVLSYIKSSKR